VNSVSPSVEWSIVVAPVKVAPVMVPPVMVAVAVGSVEVGVVLGPAVDGASVVAPSEVEREVCVSVASPGRSRATQPVSTNSAAATGNERGRVIAAKYHARARGGAC